MPVQRCPRCGTARRGDLQVCVRCETPFDAADAELDLALPRPAAPSTTQSHGTLAAALAVGFVVIAVLLYFSVRDVGPFAATIQNTRVAGSRATVTLTVQNKGGRTGRGNCVIDIQDAAGTSQPGYRFSTERVTGHQSVTFDVAFDIAAGQRPSGTVRC